MGSLRRRERILPATAERFHQRHRGYELLAAQLHGGDLDAQRGVLRCRYLKIGDETGAITVVGNFELLTGGLQRFNFRVALKGQEILGGQIVFHVGKRGQYSLTVIGHGLFVGRPGNPKVGYISSALEKRQRQ